MTRFNPNRLYKDPRNGRWCGVCAGIGDYFDVRPGVIRLLTIIGAVLTSVLPVLCAYFLLCFILDRKPDEMYEDPEEDKFWRDVRTKPEYTAVDLTKRFRDVEKRTQKLEAYVTSKRFNLDRELRDLED